MRDYIENNLQFNEGIVISPKLHWAIYLDTYLQLSVVYIIFCHFMTPFINYNRDVVNFFEISERAIGFIILLRIIFMFFRNYSVEMVVTNYRVVYKIGILNIHTDELVNSRIESVNVRQSIMGKILNYGNIMFSGTGTSKVVFKKVYAPWWIKTQAEEIIHQSIENNNSMEYNRNSYGRYL